MEFNPATVGDAATEADSGHVIVGEGDDVVQANDVPSGQLEFRRRADGPTQEMGGMEEVDAVIR